LRNEIEPALPSRMTSLKVRAYVQERPLPFGCDFLPSDPNYIRRFWRGTFDYTGCMTGMSLCAQTGFNAVRLLLSPQAFHHEGVLFLEKLERLITMADSMHLDVMLALFDDSCVNSFYHPEYADLVQDYLGTVISAYRTDERVYAFDLLTRPGFYGDDLASAHFMENLFVQARTLHSPKPLTAAICHDACNECDRCALQLSDIISFACYGPFDVFRRMLIKLKLSGRPIICTGWFSRKNAMTASAALPLLSEEQVGFFCGPVFDSPAMEGLYAANGVPMMNGSSIQLFSEYAVRNAAEFEARRRDG